MFRISEGRLLLSNLLISGDYYLLGLGGGNITEGKRKNKQILQKRKEKIRKKEERLQKGEEKKEKKGKYYRR